MEAIAGSTTTNFPDSDTLLNAQHDDTNWVLPAKTYAGNRSTGLKQITKENVNNPHMAWKTAIVDNGEQEAAPIIWNGVMYLSTPHDGVLALDAANGKLLWQVHFGFAIWKRMLAPASSDAAISSRSPERETGAAPSALFWPGGLALA